MNKFLFSLAAITVLSVGFASQAQAAPRGNTSHSSYASHASSSNYHGNSYVSYNRYANYNVNYGTRFSQGYYYTGRNHNHWSYSRFDARYGCTCYYDPSCSAWYYWCEPASCYYPVTYCPYRTYCWGSGGCSSGSCHTPFVNVSPFAGQGPVGPVGPGPNGPGFNGPVGPGPNGPVGPGSNAPVNPIMPPAANGQQSNGVPSIPTPLTPPSN